MTEGEFIKFYKKRNKNKNHEEVKKEIDRFWDTLLKALNENGPVKMCIRDRCKRKRTVWKTYRFPTGDFLSLIHISLFYLYTTF